MTNCGSSLIWEDGMVDLYPLMLRISAQQEAKIMTVKISKKKHYKVENPNDWSFTFEILTNKIFDWRIRLKSKYYEKYNNDKDCFLNLLNAIDPLQFSMLMNK